MPAQAGVGLGHTCALLTQPLPRDPESKRKITLVKELIGGKTSVATAAREHGVPEAELEQWLLAAEAGLNEAFNPIGSEPESEQEKVRALARAYGQLRAENRALKASQPE